MGKLLPFKGNAQIHLEEGVRYVEENPERIILSIQMRRIKDSLERINQLMSDLKKKGPKDAID